MNVVLYVGSKKSREIIRAYEFYGDKGKQLRLHVLLSTYEILLKDSEVFK